MSPSIIFSRSGHPISRLILALSRGRASHCAIGGLSLSGVPVVLEASIGGVTPKLRARYLAEHEIVAEYEIAAPVRVGAAIALLGEKYDYVGLAGFIPVMLARYLGRKIRNPLADPRAVVCSELVRSLDPDGLLIPEWTSLDIEATTPEDLLVVCEQRPDRFSKV